MRRSGRAKRPRPYRARGRGGGHRGRGRERLPARLVERIESRVAAGASLILTLGDRLADSSAIEGFNARLWRSDQTGLLPAKLFRKVEVKSRRDAYYRCSWFDEVHPALSFFADEPKVRRAPPHICPPRGLFLPQDAHTGEQHMTTIFE